MKENALAVKQLKHQIESADIEHLCSMLGCICDSDRLAADFVFYAPKLIKKDLVLRVWSPDEDGSFLSQEFPLYKTANCFYTSLIGITTMQGDVLGDLYQLYDVKSDEKYITPYDDYYPCGYSGKLAAMLDHKAYKWPVDEYEWLHDFKSPSHIKKVHVGTFSDSGDFKGLTEKIKSHDKSLAYDSIELLPIHEFAGMSLNYVFYGEDRLYIKKRTNQPANGWGYDICGCWLTVYANYGTPDSLKEMIGELHRNSTHVGLDSVFNHFGPDGVVFTDFADVIGGETAWGERPDFSDKFVCAWVLESIKRFVGNYHFDFVRLDQSARYEDGNETLFDIGELLPDYVIGKEVIKASHLFVIAEDEREEIAYTDDSDFICEAGTPISARWDFDFAHGAEYFTKQMSKFIPLSDESITYLVTQMFDSRNTVKYVTSHDEQGNHSGWQLRNHLLESLLIFSRDTVMTWDVDFWHFFRDSWGDVVVDVALLGEKSGLYSQITPSQWEYIGNIYHDYVERMTEAARKLHKKLKLSPYIDLFKYSGMEMFMATFHQRFFSDYENYEERLKFISRTTKGLEEAFSEVCYVHNRLMRVMANDKNIYPQGTICKASKSLQRDLRKRYAWLGMCDSAKDYFQCDPESGKIVMSRANPFVPEQEQIIGCFNFSPDIWHKYQLELSEGIWLSYRFDFEAGQFVANKVDALTDITFDVELHSYDVMIFEKQVDYRTYVPKSMYEFLRPTMAYYNEHPKGALIDRRSAFVDGDNYNLAGKFHYRDIEVCYGFTRGGNFYLFSEDKSIVISSIMTKDIRSGKYIRYSQDDFITDAKKYNEYYVMQISINDSDGKKATLGLDKRYCPIFYLELPGQVVGVYIP